LEQQDFLAVWDTLDNRILASVRLLGDHVLRFGGRFELSTLFDLRALTGTGRGRLLELDRLAVAPFERSHPHAVRLLCRTVASLVELNSIDAVLTAVHVPRSCGDGYLQAVTQELWHHARDSALPTARPWVKLPLGESATPERYVLPSAMKLLLRLGAVVYPEPAWDAERNMASYLFVLTREHRNARSWQRLIKA
jgi:putative hemolysin